jgi:nitrite reductase (NADH) large subunit
MTTVVGTYQCEWETTIEDPEKLKRFQHFINTDEQDSELAFVRERGQRRPATAAERIELVSLDSATSK